MKTSPALDFVLLAAMWGGSFLLMKIGATEIGPFATAWLRVVLAALLLLPLLAWRGQLGALRAKLGPIMLVGALNSGVPFALFGFAVLHISTGLSSVLNATTPLWGALVAWVWLRDKPNRTRLLGLAIGFAGVAALAWDKTSGQAGVQAAGIQAAGQAAGQAMPAAVAVPLPMADSHVNLLAVLACLVATLCYGIAASYTKKYLAGVPALASATGSQLGAAAFLLLPAAFHLPARAPSATAWLAIVVLAVFCTALAYVLYFRIIERAGPARAVAVTFLIPVFGVAYGSVFLGELVTLSMLLLGAVIVLGTALSTGLLSPR